MPKTTNFYCNLGKKLKKMTDAIRHDPSNILKIRLSMPNKTKQPELLGAWGYDTEHKIRQLEHGNIPMSKQDCLTVTCNMETTDTMAFKDIQCPHDECFCWMQLCDDVYDTHGHGRPSEEALEILGIYLNSKKET